MNGSYVLMNAEQARPGKVRYITIYILYIYIYIYSLQIQYKCTCVIDNLISINTN